MASTSSFVLAAVVLLNSVAWGLGDASKCQLPKNASIFGFEVLPGDGWDNLKNEIRGRVILRNYSKCQMTEDGQYLIPNGVFAIPVNK